jgi:hypothetical protein
VYSIAGRRNSVQVFVPTTLDGQFDCFDLVEVGQPVETLEPAVLCDGEPVKRGMLRSVAG